MKLFERSEELCDKRSEEKFLQDQRNNRSAIPAQNSFRRKRVKEPRWKPIGDCMRSNDELVNYLVERNALFSPHVIEAFRRVDRRHFFPKSVAQAKVYEDEARTTRERQTISQPRVVAWMIEALDLKPKHSVLELGTGSGYTTSLIAHAMQQGTIHSFDVNEASVEQALKNMRKIPATKTKVIIRSGDPLEKVQRGNYDRIIVHAATPLEAMLVLLGHLKPGGKIVAPVGTKDFQSIAVFTREKKGFRQGFGKPVKFEELRKKDSRSYFREELLDWLLKRSEPFFKKIGRIS